MQSWPANLADWMDWMSDGPIIRGWQLLRGARARKGETARGRFLQAVERGLPVYTDGLRLLVDGLKVVDREARGKDDQVSIALQHIGRYGAATDWSRPVLTFTGSDPDLPAAPPAIGFPASREGLLFLYEITLEDLIEHGLLRPGTRLELDAQPTVLTRPEQVTATITPGATIRTTWEYMTPVEAILPEFVSTGDAWWSWRRADGLTLAELRQRARSHPPVTPEEELSLSVNALGLSTRVEKILVGAGVGTLGDLLESTPEKVLAIPNVGRKALTEIEDAVAGLGLSLSPEQGSEPESDALDTVPTIAQKPRGRAKLDFVQRVAGRAGLTNRDAAKAVDAILESLTEILGAGDSISFSGFGKFSAARGARRMGFNPRTGERFTITAPRSPSFSPASALKAAVRRGRGRRFESA
jgi:nucleoid DNA-binding protein